MGGVVVGAVALAQASSVDVVGWAVGVRPYPVDFRTGESTPLTEYSLAHSLLRWQTALHEWLGVLAYGLTR